MTAANKKRVHKSKVKFEPKAGRDYKLAEAADADRMTELGGYVGKLEEMLAANLSTIIEIGDILNKSQPPCAGKIEVRFWSMRGGEKISPTVVVWSETGKVVSIPPTKLPQKAKSRISFKDNLDETRYLLKILEELFTRRQKLLDMMTTFKRSVTSFERLVHVGLMEYRGSGVLREVENLVDKNNYQRNNPTPDSDQTMPRP